MKVWIWAISWCVISSIIIAVKCKKDEKRDVIASRIKRNRRRVAEDFYNGNLFN